MRFRKVVMVILCMGLALCALPVRAVPVASAQQSQLSAMQRIDVMRSKLETLRRTLNSAIAGLNAKDKGAETTADDPRARLGGLEKEAGRLLSEIEDVRGKQERAERYDPTTLDKLEAAVTDMDNRVQVAMRETARDRRTNAVAETNNTKKKKGGGGFLGLGKIFGRGGDDQYVELVGTVAPGRDQQLFAEATNETRKDNYETARALYSVII
ncbi:MAG: hypothetical protein H7Z38_05720, partial [Rubrivivax sp.]|nr:hypothetical protein [Pyrinomonadaceae bacterium]